MNVFLLRLVMEGGEQRSSDSRAPQRTMNYYMSITNYNVSMMCLIQLKYVEYLFLSIDVVFSGSVSFLSPPVVSSEQSV